MLSYGPLFHNVVGYKISWLTGWLVDGILRTRSGCGSDDSPLPHQIKRADLNNNNKNLFPLYVEVVCVCNRSSSFDLRLAESVPDLTAWNTFDHQRGSQEGSKG